MISTKSDSKLALLFALMSFTGVLSDTSAVQGQTTSERKKSNMDPATDSAKASGLALATFGGGCFWCLEAVFERFPGVKDVTSGYAGGKTENPTYKQVCAGTTGHAEVVQITFDPAIISYDQLLEIFWACHDPTTLNRQGNDIGTQYRSVIFYHSDSQRDLAKKSVAAASGHFPRPIVTEVLPSTRFHTAEAYHQDYYRNNASASYCQAIIAPKLRKLKLDR